MPIPCCSFWSVVAVVLQVVHVPTVPTAASVSGSTCVRGSMPSGASAFGTGVTLSPLAGGSKEGGNGTNPATSPESPEGLGVS